MKYEIIVEKGNSGWGAYIINLPGCVAVAETKEAVVELIKESIKFHLEGLN
jgi:predicted RNase H-like HicB family nuclease